MGRCVKGEEFIIRDAPSMSGVGDGRQGSITDHDERHFYARFPHALHALSEPAEVVARVSGSESEQVRSLMARPGL